MVEPPDKESPTNSGGNILAAIAQGISLLTGKVQAPPFALIADTNAFAGLGSVINGAPAYTVLNPILTGGIHGTWAMPSNTALLIALGGDPTTIYVGSDPVTEPTQKEAGGKYLFRTFERVQFVARDARAFVRLNFSYLSGSTSDKGSSAAEGRERRRTGLTAGNRPATKRPELGSTRFYLCLNGRFQITGGFHAPGTTGCGRIRWQRRAASQRPPSARVPASGFGDSPDVFGPGDATGGATGSATACAAP